MLTKPIIYGGAALAFAALFALGVGWTVSAWRGALADAAKMATEARDAHWRSEIEKHNQRVAEAVKKAADEAARADSIAREVAAREAQLQSELEKRNDALPGANAPGLSRDRVCLISPASCAQ